MIWPLASFHDQGINPDLYSLMHDTEELISFQLASDFRDMILLFTLLSITISVGSKTLPQKVNSKTFHVVHISSISVYNACLEGIGRTLDEISTLLLLNLC